MSPARLALVSVLQFAEGLTDWQAAHAVRSRLDWKYALSLELTDTGFAFSVLSEFRDRLVGSDAGRMVFDAVLRAAGDAGLVKAGKRQRTDATHVLAATRDLNRLEFVVETLRAALNQVAEAAGEWLAGVVTAEWFDRYPARPEGTRLPSRWAARIEHADQCGADGVRLLEAVWSAAAPPGLRGLPAVEILRQTWVQQVQHVDGTVRWRELKNLPPGMIRLRTPHEPDARTGSKREVDWSGYKVHLSETCQPHAPHLITHVHTTPAPVTDVAVLEDIHTALAERGLLPEEHLVDTGYVDAGKIHHARRDHHVELVGTGDRRPGTDARRRGRISAARAYVHPYTTLCTVVRMGYGLLAAAIAAEVAGTTAMKFSEGFSRLWPSLFTVVGYLLAFTLLAQTLKTLSVGTAYAIWAGIGTAAVAAIGMLFLGESANLVKISGIALVIAGVVVLNLGGAH